MCWPTESVRDDRNVTGSGSVTKWSLGGSFERGVGEGGAELSRGVSADTTRRLPLTHTECREDIPGAHRGR